MDIRRALPADLPAIAAIYAREALEGHATFDLEPRPMELWEARLGDDREHFLVADGDGTVIGYATSSPFRPKPAYAHVVAAVALPNAGSLALHRACGFEEVGVMREVGRKHGRWIDVAWLQKVLD
jgi:phosphinothricin acetyltransferase